MCALSSNGAEKYLYFFPIHWLNTLCDSHSWEKFSIKIKSIVQIYIQKSNLYYELLNTCAVHRDPGIFVTF